MALSKDPAVRQKQLANLARGRELAAKNALAGAKPKPKPKPAKEAQREPAVIAYEEPKTRGRPAAPPASPRRRRAAARAPAPAPPAAKPRGRGFLDGLRGNW